MKFSVMSVEYGRYGNANTILKTYPKITNWLIEDVETIFGLQQMLTVELNTAEDFLRFVKEVDCKIIIEDIMRNGKPSILIYDDSID